MKMIILIIIIAVFLVLVFWPIKCGTTTLEEGKMNYGISIYLDKLSYTLGEPIKIVIKVFNYTEEEVVFYFNTSQRYDFIIADEEGNEIWRWSKDKMFAMALEEEILGPNNPEIIYTVEYKDKLNFGNYKITGILVAQGRAMSGSITAEVK